MYNNGSYQQKFLGQTAASRIEGLIEPKLKSSVLDLQNQQHALKMGKELGPETP